MLQEYADRINWAKSNRKLIRKYYTRGTHLKGLDSTINKAHNQAFECTDCLQCANCCKTTGPLFLYSDVKRLAKRLKMTASAFTETYLREDEEGDLILKSVPCPFLMDDNKCEVYEDRPRACRAYPHTDDSGQAAISKLTERNSRICPAVAHIFLQLTGKR